MRSQKLRLFVVGAVLFALSWVIYWMSYVNNKPTSQEKALQYSNLAFKLSQLKDQDRESKKAQELQKEQERINKERKLQLAVSMNCITICSICHSVSELLMKIRIIGFIKMLL